MVSSDTAADEVAESVVTIEQTNGTWWFVGPDDDRFVTLGVNHIEPHLWLGSYNCEETIERYGEDFVTMYGTFNPYGDAAEEWMERVVDTVKDLGFNSLGKHVLDGIPHQYYADDVYYIASLDTAPIPSWKQVQENAFKKFGPFPDPFSDEFEHDLAHQVEQLCRKHRSNDNLLGYFYADLPWWQLRRDDSVSTTSTRSSTHGPPPLFRWTLRPRANRSGSMSSVIGTEAPPPRPMSMD